MTIAASARSFSLKRLSAFGLVGGLGFMADAIVLEILSRFAGWTPLAGRLVAIAIAGALTYALNRSLTFKMQSRANVAEGGRYALGLALTSGLNYAVFAAVLALFPGVLPFVALVVASATAMSASFIWQSRVVFSNAA
jgi:putative flippase GtrA